MSKSVAQRREMVKNSNHELSKARQCELLSIHRSGLYYKPKPETAFNLELMRKIDEEYMRHPWLGVPRMTTYLREDLGLKVNKKRIARLYRIMGLQAIGPKPTTSNPSKGHKTYPYLLKNRKVESSNEVWAMDITYIPVQGGYFYLAAIIDLHSRFVVNWSLNNTMTAEWCKTVLEEAVTRFGKPKIINTDQGSQFTSEVFSTYVVDKEQLGIQLSMDGKGRAIDNIFIERLWRSVKYEHVYLFPASDGVECYEGIENYFHYYNTQRRHQSLNNKTPQTIYQQSLKSVA